jgi:PhnB protein
MAIIAYLNFNGNCREAMEYYRDTFNGRNLSFMTLGDMPAEAGFDINEENKGLIMHGYLEVFDTAIMFSDTLPHMDLIYGNNIHLNISLNDLEQLKSVFEKMRVEGKIVVELGETSWTKAYGYLIDKFGIGWMFNYQEK